MIPLITGDVSMNLDRRNLLKGIGAAGASLTFAGHASAADGSARYIVLGGGNGVYQHLDDEFSVIRELAGGDVIIVSGPDDSVDDLNAVSGVEDAVRDVQFQLEEPEQTELPEEMDAQSGDLESDWYENLWDKQNADVVEANGIATGEGAQIGIIDTGVDYDHSDLIPNLDEDAGRLFREGEIRSGAEDDIVVNDPVGGQIQRVDQHVASDVNGHGTHVAGITAADPESGFDRFGSGVQGVAPDADLISYRVFWWQDFSDDGEDPDWGPTTTSADVLTAIDFGAEQGLDAVNLSLGTPPYQPRENQKEDLRTIRLAYETVVRSAVNRGTVVVASAGNADTDLQRGGLFSLPNSTKGAMSISALAPNNERSFFSNFGTNEIDVGTGGGAYETNLKTLYGIREWFFSGAPLRRSEHPLEEGDEGELWLDEDGDLIVIPQVDDDGNIIRDPEEYDVDAIIPFESPAWPYPFNLVFSTTSPLNEGAPYGWKAGTSMSAPNVAGLVALVKELEPDASPNQVESAIKKGAEGGNGRSDPVLGAGSINALNTVEALADDD